MGGIQQPSKNKCNFMRSVITIASTRPFITASRRVVITYYFLLFWIVTYKTSGLTKCVSSVYKEL